MRTRHFESAADRCDFAHFDSAALCAAPPAERCQVKSGRTNLVGIIGGDKTKTQAYCRILDLGRQLNQAVGDKDEKKLKALARQVKRLELPEFVALSNVLKGVDLNSPDGREIASIVQSLNQSCAD